ncbi:hypothetical protein N7532_011902 [Penicillium argentinense]|uniref:NYN domain-containing protein n=1 Tax=Penicillium argentinense TaxID=1131581 RepID=A0A9W9JV07_9EURO|nr:uncharacterized protein N7532_011902 [Penicillium argentinense]KAJ5082859.1 hypothetical protein N7532_011902 [Penicillium argentinense]
MAPVDPGELASYGVKAPAAGSRCQLELSDDLQNSGYENNPHDSDPPFSPSMPQHELRAHYGDQPLNPRPRSPRGLGDFRSLWATLLQRASPFRPAAPDSTANLPVSSSDRRFSVRPSSPITIIKRPAQHSAIGTAAHAESIHFKEPSDVSGQTLIFTRLRPIESRGHDLSMSNAYREPTLAEGTSDTEADLGSDTAVFDRPVSRPIPRRPRHLAFVPAQLGMIDASDDHGYETPPSSIDEREPARATNGIDTKVVMTATGLVIRPVYRNKRERNLALERKLIVHFPEISCRLPYASLEKPWEVCIHVFVDFSNIWVGLKDTIKAQRSISPRTKINRVNLSFANLSRILERGRLVAKRVLAGSDTLPSVDEAKTLGYEVNILDRVRKKPINRRHNNYKGPVEQGVDEILLLKMVESVVDNHPGTIVLATGDGEKGEYSGGFISGVNRALERGWKVELVSFSVAINHRYRKLSFRSNRVRLIELDPFAEELLGDEIFDKC